MSTTNEVESRSLPRPGLTLDPDHRLSHANAIAHAPQWNGNQYVTYIHNISAGILESSVPSSSTGLSGNRPPEPTDLPGAKRQIEAIVVPPVPNRLGSPSSERPRSSSHRSNRSLVKTRPSRACCRRAIIGTATTWTLAATVLIIFPGLVMWFIFTSGHESSEQTLNVRHGFLKIWHDRSYTGISSIWQARITLSEYQARLITGSTVLLLVLSIPSAYILLHRMFARVLGLATSPSSNISHEVEDNNVPNGNGTIPQEGNLEEDQINEHSLLLRPLLPRKWKSGVWPRILLIWSSSTSPHSSIMHLFKLLSHQKLLDEESSGWSYYPAFLGRVLLISLFCVLALAVLFGLALGSIMSVNIMTNSVVLSDHPDCGFWLRDSSIMNPSPTGFDYLQEVEAGQYAKKCYHSGAAVDGCNTFITQSISYDRYHNQQCPFEDSFCLEGKNSAYRLETKHISSKSLGINVDIGYTFKRITTCSPVQRRVTLSRDGKNYEYDYGNSTEFGAFTWSSPVNKSWEFAGYNVVTLYYKANSSYFNWSPSSEFAPWAHDAITLLLIDSQKNYHTAPSHDPIFPAEHSLAPYPGRSPLYFNDDPRATALACVDTTKICDASGQICYDNIYKPYPDLPSDDEITGYYMLLISLIDSTTFDAIQLVGGRALVAEAKLEHQVSLPLAEEQWKVEVENLFETTLVRPQITLRDYIRGRAAKDPEYSDRTLAGMHDMCNTYKFRGRGWKNIPVWGIVMIVVIVVVIYVLCIEVQGYQMVLKRGDEEFLGRLGAEDTDDEEFYLATRREKILLAEWIFDSMFGTTASIEGAEWNEVGTHREISRNSTEGGGASPRICISGPGHQGSQSPEIQGSLSGQHAGPATARSSAEEERSASAVEGSGI